MKYQQVTVEEKVVKTMTTHIPESYVQVYKDLHAIALLSSPGSPIEFYLWLLIQMDENAEMVVTDAFIDKYNENLPSPIIKRTFFTLIRKLIAVGCIERTKNKRGQYRMTAKGTHRSFFESNGKPLELGGLPLSLEKKKRGVTIFEDEQSWPPEGYELDKEKNMIYPKASFADKKKSLKELLEKAKEPIAPLDVESYHRNPDFIYPPVEVKEFDPADFDIIHNGVEEQKVTPIEEPTVEEILSPLIKPMEVTDQGIAEIKHDGPSLEDIVLPVVEERQRPVKPAPKIVEELPTIIDEEDELNTDGGDELIL